jgi:hypothetical protein
LWCQQLQVVEHGGDILEKADDEAAAFAMLSK